MDFKQLSDILKTGKSLVINNPILGNIFIDKGTIGKSGYGLLHIIEQRLVKNKLIENEIAALICLVKEALDSGILSNDKIKLPDKFGLEKNGVIAIIKKAADRKGKKFVLTGYAINEKKEESTEAIKTVIALYGCSPEFSDFRNQVGAIVSSLK
ncbi:MAG: hypothetical protein FWF38_05950 [Spirochaetaceae bacterium]|nr:hypothetical protein [Spirochaetaceae bacterium]